MGIPKAFRWISERYPLCLVKVDEDEIPEFDNLYLDMNGIIHNCTHGDNKKTGNVTQLEMFVKIFNYISKLFDLIKPNKLFFLAIDGVAPRAKMNQQRARRFKTALENEEALKKESSKSKELLFDSNCITPGTEFMYELGKYIHYFIKQKIDEDQRWQKIRVYFSGQETPGEGEHKIMDFIRHLRSKKDYDPNTTHCLYGLDADLLMLGLSTHDPHFSLLREEVNYGRMKKEFQANEDESFYLFHLSIFREYLEIELKPKKQTKKKFEYNFERVLDDFIFLFVLIGNDFVPNLPNLQINKGALVMIFAAYRKWLSEGDGYLHEHGKLEVKRFELFLKYFYKFEHTSYKNNKLEYEMDDEDDHDQTQYVFLQIEEFTTKILKDSLDVLCEPIEFKTRTGPQALMLRQLVEEVNLSLGEEYLVLREFKDTEGIATTNNPNLIFDIQNIHLSEVNKEDIRASLVLELENAMSRIRTEIPEDDYDYDENSIEELTKLFEPQTTLNNTFDGDPGFVKWKEQYYRNKLQIDNKVPAEINRLKNSYVEALQWILNYYYTGVPSWSWFYPYYYTPMITDLRDLDFKFDFEIGAPLNPLVQLMGVLPVQSKSLVPIPLQTLMTNIYSPIHDFYPQTFQTDLNGKSSTWEAVVKIPFIDETRLVKYVTEVEYLFNEKTKQRNKLGNPYIFSYGCEPYILDPPSKLLPMVKKCRCKCEETTIPTIIQESQIKRGILPNTLLGREMKYGFPSLRTLDSKGSLKIHNIKIFGEKASKNETIVLTVNNSDSHKDILKSKNVEKYLNTEIYIGWPYLKEAKIVEIVNTENTFTYVNKDTQKTQNSDLDKDILKKTYSSIRNRLSERYAVEIDKNNPVLAYCLPIKGMEYTLDGSFKKKYASSHNKIAVPFNTIVHNVAQPNLRHVERITKIEDVYPIKGKVFFIGPKFYGSAGEVVEHIHPNKLKVKLICDPLLSLNLKDNKDYQRWDIVYYRANQILKQFNISYTVLSKLTGNIFVEYKKRKVNIGLCLKYEGKGLKVAGMTRKNREWEYSTYAVSLITKYNDRFPEVIETLERNQKKNYYEPKDFYPADDPRKIEDIVSFLDEVLRDCQAYFPVSTELLERDEIAQIQTFVSRQYTQQPLVLEQKVVNNVPRHLVLRPGYLKFLNKQQTFELEDRVVYVNEDGKAPTGIKGFVTGIMGGFLEVLFDHTYVNGSDSSGRCPEYASAWVSKKDVLNLTNWQIYRVSKPLTPSSQNTQLRDAFKYNYKKEMKNITTNRKNQ